MRLRKHWLRRTNLIFRVSKKDGAMTLNGKVLRDVHIIELVKWLGLWIKYRKKSLRTYSLDEARVHLRRAEEIIKSNQ